MAEFEFSELKRARSKRVEEIIRKSHRTPIGLYTINEKLSALVHNPGFLDAVLITIAFFSAATSLKFYPLAVMVVVAVALFAITVKKPFPGLILLMLSILPLFMYQMPALAWIYLMVMSASLIYGHMHYRTILFMYMLIAMAFSPIGYILSIPMFIIAVLVIGYRRAVLMSFILVIAIVSLSGLSGLQNTAYIVYNAAHAHSVVGNAQVLTYATPDKEGFSIYNFTGGLSQAYSTFTGGAVLDNISSVVGPLLSSLAVNPAEYIPELAVLVILAFTIDAAAVSSRSRYRGTQASIIGIGYPASYLALTFIFSTSPSLILPFASFVVAPATLYLLEFFDVKIVKALDIRKQDLRMKFGEAFEDLEAGNTSERFSDIGNYEATKKELKDAVLAPIEEKGISKAYNVKPAKGILFFGPPGTGKTMMMRALANEIHAGFFYVKASNLISAFPGETEKMISNIFTIAKKHSPCILFFDEIDSVATSRDSQNVSETSRQALSQLLVEMDGFQKSTNVIMVGATNVPNLIDKAIMRPGRFDKVIYMPPPDARARKLIFEMYLKKLPVSKEIDLDEIAEKTERYTGADIKVLCEGVAQKMAQEAATEHKVLEITQEDMMNRIGSTRPSVSLAQIDNYNKFRLDFERSVYGQQGEESRENLSVDRDVIGLDDAKKAIYEAVQIPLLHKELVKKYDIKNINGILLFGPPGCGKTLMIRALYTELEGVTMLEINGADISQQGLERATATIKETFNRARENAPAIILLDEAEELMLKRSQASEFSAQMTSEMLREIDGVSKIENIVVIATTNRPEAIDPAALRPGRLDKLVFIKPPNRLQRVLHFKNDLKSVPVASDVDYDRLAEETIGFTGADIYHVCREAKTAALEQNIKSGQEAEVTMALLEGIVAKVRPSAPEEIVAQYLSFYSKYGER